MSERNVVSYNHGATISSLNLYVVMHFTVFSNTLKDTQIHILADSDEHEVVQQVQVFS